MGAWHCASPCVHELGRKWQDGQASEKDWVNNVCVLAPDSACQWFLLLSMCSWLGSNTMPLLPFLNLHSYLRLSLTAGSSSLFRLVAVPRQIMIAMAITLLACFSDGYYEPLLGEHMNLARPACYRRAYHAEAVIKLSNSILSEQWLVFSYQFILQPVFTHVHLFSSTLSTTLTIDSMHLLYSFSKAEYV